MSRDLEAGGKLAQDQAAGFIGHAAALAAEQEEKLVEEAFQHHRKPCSFCGGGGIVNAVEGGQALCPKCDPVDQGEIIMRNLRGAGIMIGALMRRLGVDELRLTARELVTGPGAHDVTIEDDPVEGGRTIRIRKETLP